MHIIEIEHTGALFKAHAQRLEHSLKYLCHGHWLSIIIIEVGGINVYLREVNVLGRLIHRVCRYLQPRERCVETYVGELSARHSFVKQLFDASESGSGVVETRKNTEVAKGQRHLVVGGILIRLLVKLGVECTLPIEYSVAVDV